MKSIHKRKNYAHGPAAGMLKGTAASRRIDMLTDRVTGTGLPAFSCQLPGKIYACGAPLTFPSRHSCRRRNAFPATRRTAGMTLPANAVFHQLTETGQEHNRFTLFPAPITMEKMTGKEELP
jgi:hypothetical protein